jgi:site-specific recombinase XerD
MNSRPSFATNQLNAGTDIAVVSGLLRHINVKTRQGYAKVNDKRNLEAAQRISIK